MIKTGILKALTEERAFTSRDGVAMRALTCVIDFPYYTPDGKPFNDSLLAVKFIEDTPEAKEALCKLLGQQREFTINLSLRSYNDPQRGIRYFQDAVIKAIKTKD